MYLITIKIPECGGRVQDFDIIVMFAQHYRATFDQEAVYIKISETTTELITE
ncbi:hypothetical protein HC864_05240 [Candidatus Gracilibacteria bacterium]|nr:hypothetical protein [Candidatus Gracilibacteria bacterium]